VAKDSNGEINVSRRTLVLGGAAIAGLGATGCCTVPLGPQIEGACTARPRSVQKLERAAAVDCSHVFRIATADVSPHGCLGMGSPPPVARH
jgi:hypothetical protein